MGKTARNTATLKYKEEGPERSRLRKLRDIKDYIPEIDMPAFRKSVEALRSSMKCEAPKMTCADSSCSDLSFSLSDAIANEAFHSLSDVTLDGRPVQAGSKSEESLDDGELLCTVSKSRGCGPMEAKN